MIVRVEKILADTFCKIERVKGERPIWFGYGDKMELDSILLQKQRDKYPLLWYIMPNKLSFSDGNASGKFTFLLAHNTRLDWNNDQRFEKVYEEILFPYMEKMFLALARSGNTSFTLDSEYSWVNVPNYSNESQNATEGIDYWDAIKIEIDDMSLKEDNKC